MGNPYAYRPRPQSKFNRYSVTVQYAGEMKEYETMAQTEAGAKANVAYRVAKDWNLVVSLVHAKIRSGDIVFTIKQIG